MPEDLLSELARERNEITERINELLRQRDALDAIIARRSGDALLVSQSIKPTRKNEKQLYYWRLILQILEEEKRNRKNRGLRTFEIFDRLSKDGERLSYGTFRSYLHRLKKDERIYQRQRSGPWRLAETQKDKEAKNM